MISPRGQDEFKGQPTFYGSSSFSRRTVDGFPSSSMDEDGPPRVCTVSRRLVFTLRPVMEITFHMTRLQVVQGFISLLQHILMLYIHHMPFHKVISDIKWILSQSVSELNDSLAHAEEPGAQSPGLLISPNNHLLGSHGMDKVSLRMTCTPMGHR